MENKIDYHVLSMDEIVFDNRNKAYGAFVVRQVYKHNLLKAIITSIGIFCLAMSSPTILKNLGLIAERQIDALQSTILTAENFDDVIQPPAVKAQEIQKPPAGPKVTSEIIIPVKPEELTKEKEVKLTKDPDIILDPPGPSEGGTGNGNPGDGSGGGGDGEHFDPNKVIEGYGTLEEFPEFIGGEKKFKEFLDDNLIYPEPEREDGIEGVTKIQFIVNADGSIVQARIFKSSGYSNLDTEALKLVKMLPKYKPGRQNGHAVRVLCVLPIGFELN